MKSSIKSNMSMRSNTMGSSKSMASILAVSTVHNNNNNLSSNNNVGMSKGKVQV